MTKRNLSYTFVTALAFCTLGSASPISGADPRLLSLVPPGAAIVGGLTQGTPASYLVQTANNTTDLMDFLSISGVDPTRRIERSIFVTASGSRDFLSEHSWSAIGHFDSRHIFKAAQESGAIKSQYLGIPVLFIQPLQRDKGISDDVRWLAVIDSEIAVFGTVPMVREELARHQARSPADRLLISKLSHLRSKDQSWCVLTSAVYRREPVRRTLAALDPVLVQQPDHADEGLILGIHFGRQVEIDYESIQDSYQSNENPPQAQPIFSEAANQGPLQQASYLVGNSDAKLPKVIRLSRKRYDKLIAQEQVPKKHDEQRLSQPTRK